MKYLMKNSGFWIIIGTDCLLVCAAYVLTNIKKIPGKDSRERVMDLLQQTGAAGVPGEAFFQDNAGENLVRFCFTKEDPILEEACRKIEGFSRRAAAHKKDGHLTPKDV